MSSYRFRYVVCQIDRLRRNFPASIRTALAELPESLDQTYEQTLLGIDKEKRNYAQRLFQCLAVSIRPLRVDELAETLAVRFDIAGVPSFNPNWRPADAAVLSACSSLVAIVDVGNFQVVQFTHFSVKEFLTSERLATADKGLSYYHILPETAHMVLSRASLAVLLQLDDKIDKETIRHFPLAQYAARYWVDHAQFSNVSTLIQDMMEPLFDQAKAHYAAWIWLFDMDHHWVEPMSDIHPKQPEAVPLYYASLCGFRDLVDHLIVAHPHDVNAMGGFRATPLHAASANGHLQVVQLLLTKNANANSCDDNGGTPLHTASRYGHLEIVKELLVHGVDVNQSNGEGLTPLHFASIYGNQTARLPNQCGVHDDDQEAPTLLDRAAGGGNPQIVQLLINSGANVNSPDNYGYTPLHWAARQGTRDIAEILLVSGANLEARNDIGNNVRQTPLHVACAYRRLELSRFFLDHGSDLD
jgi:ankyrin repeat protein